MNLRDLCACSVCGRIVPRYYLSAGRCDDCHWDTYIPPDYPAGERYRPDRYWGHLNATARPPLGVEFLDRPGPGVAQTLQARRYRPVL